MLPSFLEKILDDVVFFLDYFSFCLIVLISSSQLNSSYLLGMHNDNMPGPIASQG